jgi:hypothetical protein
MSVEVLATATELREATDKAISVLAIDTRSLEEKNTEWLQWFSKRGVRLLKDAIQLGKYSLTVDVPYQPSSKDAEKGLMVLRKQLRHMIPGCSVNFIEEVYEGQTFCTMLIGWEKGQS